MLISKLASLATNIETTLKKRKKHIRSDQQVTKKPKKRQNRKLGENAGVEFIVESPSGSHGSSDQGGQQRNEDVGELAND